MPQLMEIANVGTDRSDLGRPMRLLFVFRIENGGSLRPRITGQVAVAMLLLATLCIAHPASSDKVQGTSAPESPFREISVLLRQKKYSAAKQQLLRLKLQYPQSARFFFLLGTAEYHLGEFHEAEDAFQRSLAINPNAPSTLYNLGILLLDLKRPASAIQYLEKSQKLMSPSAGLSINLIRAYLDNKQPGRARRIAESAGQEFHNSPAFFLALGNCYLRHGLASQGRTALEHANRLLPAQPEIILPLAEICLQQRDIPCTARSLEGIRSQAQNIPQYHFLVAQANFLTGHQSKCLAEMQEALRLDPRNASYLLALGRYYQKYGQQDKAINVLQTAEAIDPQQPEIPYSIAVSFFIKTNFKKAASYVDRALRLNPNFVRALFLKGISNLTLVNYGETDKFLGRALQLDPRNPYCECFLGMSYLAQEQLDKAALHLRRASELVPSYALPHYEMGRVFLRKGNLQAVREEERKAIALDPQLYEAYYVLGLVLQRLGQKEEAAKDIGIFEKYRARSYSERREMLREMQKVVTQGQ